MDRSHLALLEPLFEGVYILDGNRLIEYWNPAAEEISGYPAAETLGKTCSDHILTHLDDDGKNLCHTPLCPIEQTFTSGRVTETHAYLQHREGYRVPVEIRTIPIFNPAGEIVRVVEAFRETLEVVRYRKRIAELERLALLDPLTGLANRRFTDITLNSRLLDFKRYSWPLGLLFADLDNFKRINDRFGHDTGDRALNTMARTMSNAIRTSDFVGRFGGEEFVILVSDTQVEEINGIAEKLRRYVEKSYFPAGGQPQNLTVSIGATLARPDDTPESLIKRADELMYRCKRSGGNCVLVE